MHFFLALSILQERKLQSVVFVNIVFRKFTKWTYEHALTERHAITFREQLINLLYQPAWVILVRLGEINMIPLIILNKTQSFITGYNVSFIINKYMIRPFITCCNRMGHLPTYSMWQPIELQYGTIYYLRQYIYWMNIHKSSWS